MTHTHTHTQGIYLLLPPHATRTSPPTLLPTPSPTLTPLAPKHPHRVASMALISALIGGFAKTAPAQKLTKYKCIFSFFCCCCRWPVATKVLNKKLVPKLYERCDHQAEEGADPDGLPVAKAMYRVKVGIYITIPNRTHGHVTPDT